MAEVRACVEMALQFDLPGDLRTDCIDALAEHCSGVSRLLDSDDPDAYMEIVNLLDREALIDLVYRAHEAARKR